MYRGPKKSDIPWFFFFLVFFWFATGRCQLWVENQPVKDDPLPTPLAPSPDQKYIAGPKFGNQKRF